MTNTTISFTHWWRLRPWSGNSLMRLSDRLEALSILVIAVVLALLVPVAGAVATNTYSHLSGTAETDRERDHQVSAVLTDDAPQPLVSTAASAANRVEHAHARWSVNGVTHTGLVTADSGAKAGQTVPIWIDPVGDNVRAPRSGLDNALAAVGAAVGVWAAGSTGCVLVVLGLHWQANRHRLRQWQREWDGLDRRTGWSLS
ncbi:Rv1733c family protein [Rhodococcus sp. ACT016]|uniref:Rv1733c family protein n=1 Tax=Rhodococcus sp. ACT016 TaxID=3134808 RepID=UPI003D27D118